MIRRLGSTPGYYQNPQARQDRWSPIRNGKIVKEPEEEEIKDRDPAVIIDLSDEAKALM